MATETIVIENNTVEEAPQTEEATTATEPSTETPATDTPNETTETPTETPPAESPKPVVPEKYELALPKDSVLPEATVERTAAIARELGLDNAAAQKVLESINAEAAALEKARADAWEPGKGAEWKRRDEEWKTEALKDAEIGGTPDKLKVSAEKAQLVLQKFFPPDVMDFLQASGLGSHPAVIKGLAKIGRSMSEGSLVLGAPPAPPQRKTGELFYENNGEGPKKVIDAA